MPIGSASSIQRIAPPKTSDAVTGAASRIVWFTSRRFVNERPSEWSIVSRFRNIPYWIGTGRSSPSRCEAFAMHSSVAR